MMEIINYLTIQYKNHIFFVLLVLAQELIKLYNANVYFICNFTAESEISVLATLHKSKFMTVFQENKKGYISL